MRRGMLIALYGLGGIGVAAALAWAAFSVAGHQLSTPADPIQPVGVTAISSGAPATPRSIPPATTSIGPRASSHPSSDDAHTDGQGDD
jgi:hypothetical protein